MRPRKILISNVRFFYLLSQFLLLEVAVLAGLFFIAEEYPQFSVYVKSWKAQLAGLVSVGLLLLLTVYLLIRHVGYLSYRPGSDVVQIKIGPLHEEIRILDKTIWWNYIFGRGQSGPEAKPIANRISLWLTLKGTKGEAIVLNNRLMPWKSTPAVPYSTDLEPLSNSQLTRKNYFITGRNLQKIHQEIRLPSAKG